MANQKESQNNFRISTVHDVQFCTSKKFPRISLQLQLKKIFILFDVTETYLTPLEQILE